MLYQMNQYLKVIKISGVDSKNFLQGQTCNDVANLREGCYQISANLNNKGRIYTNFWLYCIHDELFYLVLSADMADLLVMRLKLYVLRSKVQIEIIDNNILLTDDITDLPTNMCCINLVHNIYICVVLDHSLEIPNLICLDNIQIWYRYLFESKLVLINLVLSQQLLVQQISFDCASINGVSYQKGCYIGQEIVARMHYLGKNKQNMYAFVSSNKVDLGQILYTDKLPNQEIGVVVLVYMDNDKYIGFVSIQDMYIDDVYIDNNQYTQKLEIQNLRIR